MARYTRRNRFHLPPGPTTKVGFLTAVALYAGLAPAFIAQAADDLALSPLLPSALQMVPWVSGLALLVAPVAWMRHKRRHLLDSRASLESLRGLSWRDFRRLVGDGFRRQGYAVQPHPRAGPTGVFDLVLTKDTRKILVQCWHGDRAHAGLEAARLLHASMDAQSATGGLIVTSGTISAEGRAFSDDKPIALIEGRTLMELVLRTREVRSGGTGAPIRREPYLGISIEPSRECPRCGAVMVEAPRGVSTLVVDPQPWVCESADCAGSSSA
jgi:restriction system protein